LTLILHILDEYQGRVVPVLGRSKHKIVVTP